jgi:hypothetical protein
MAAGHRKMMEPHNVPAPKRTPDQQREYMRHYMRARRAEHVHVAKVAKVVQVTANDAAQEYHIKFLRDDTRTLMFPERIFGSETPWSDANRIIDTAEKRRMTGGQVLVPVKTRPKPVGNVGARPDGRNTGT